MQLISDKLKSILAHREIENLQLELKGKSWKKTDKENDEIDKVLAKHYGFTEEELDYIINYDIKYRMGKELEGE